MGEFEVLEDDVPVGPDGSYTSSGDASIDYDMDGETSDYRQCVIG